MTPAERKAALVERGVQEMQDAATLWLYENPTLRPENIPYELLFTAALTVALEEAAKVAKMAGRYPVGAGDGTTNVIGTADDAAAAIRALISEGGK